MKFIFLLLLSFSINFCYSQHNNKNDSIQNVKNYIKNESVGGKLDFSKMIVGYGDKSQEEARHKAYLYSISLWAYSVKDLGISNYEEVVTLWEEIHEREITSSELSAIHKGLSDEE